MILTTPEPKYAESFNCFVEDYLRAGDAVRATKYSAAKASFTQYVKSLWDAANGIGLPEGQVAYTTYWLVNDEQIIGVVRLRPTLTSSGEKYDGHIGYDIAPTHQGKGYGTSLLKMSLAEARRFGLSHVVVTCLAANIPSVRTIEKCGGRLIEVVDDEESGQPLNRYELATPSS